MEQYDPQDYSVTFNGIPIEGFDGDDFIDIEFDSEGYQDDIGDNRVWSEILEAKRKETGKVIDAQIEARKIAADAAEAKKKADAEEEARKKAEALAEAARQAEAKRLAEDCPEFSTVEHIREFESSLKKAQLDSTKTRMMFSHLNKTWYVLPESKEQLLNPGEGD